MLLRAILQWPYVTFWKGSVISEGPSLWLNFFLFWGLCCGWCVTGSSQGLFLPLTSVCIKATSFCGSWGLFPQQPPGNSAQEHKGNQIIFRIRPRAASRCWVCWAPSFCSFSLYILFTSSCKWDARGKQKRKLPLDFKIIFKIICII